MNLSNPELSKENVVFSKCGKVLEVYQNYLVCKGPISKIGSILQSRSSNAFFEVVGTSNNGNVLMPLTEDISIGKGELLYPSERVVRLPLDDNKLLGKVINAYGEPINNAPLGATREVSLKSSIPNALSRARVTEPIETKIRAIDTFLTIGRGQKIGIFAGTGVGKSTLLGLLAKQSSEDINVIALIGERGREVREFMERELGEEGMKRSVIVVSTSDESPLLHIKAAELATSIAEKFRDKGKNVLLMMDSVSRYVMARRILDIATGAIPVNGGRTLGMEPSLQKLLERSGNNEYGSITGIYSVLVENDDFNAPIPDMARGILDGHIVLTRKLADKNHFPAIDVLSSVSRVMQDIVEAEHNQNSREAKKYLSIFSEIEDQYKLGLIERGKDINIDKAIALNGPLNNFLQQTITEKQDFNESLTMLKGILN